MNSPRPDIAFDELLTALKKEGFHLTPTDYVEFTAVFNRFVGTREELRLSPCPHPLPQPRRSTEVSTRSTTAMPLRPRSSGTRPAPQARTTNPYITPATASCSFSASATRQVYGWFFLLSLIASIVELRLHKHVAVPKITITIPAPVNADGGRAA